MDMWLFCSPVSILFYIERNSVESSNIYKNIHIVILYFCFLSLSTLDDCQLRLEFLMLFNFDMK